MKKISFVFAFIVCAPLLIGGYSDGYITAGEYEYGVIWTSNTKPLIVSGGGADVIEMRNNSHLEVRSTSSPLGLDIGGILDITLLGNSQLLYLDGKNDLIRIGTNATAVLKGGSINYLWSFQYTTTTGANPHIDLYCKPNWSWVSNNPLLGIQGQWLNGSQFRIEFINQAGYDPVWTNINIMPEPTTVLLLGLGGLLVRRKRV